MHFSDFESAETKPCFRITVFALFLTSMCLLYYHYDSQYYNFINNYPTTSIILKNYNESEILEEDVKNGYIVWSPSCHIPNITANHESIKKFIFKWKSITCSQLKPLTEVVYNATSGKHSVRMIRERLHEYLTKPAVAECCYSVISRDYLKETQNEFDDNRFKIGIPVCFDTETELSPSAEFIYVTCQSKSKSKFKHEYKNIHGVVVDKNVRRDEDTKSDSRSTNTPRYSVLLIGIDSISRLNMIRALPKTRRFVEENGWLPLEGYNKIADNTFPNLISILTGLTTTQLAKRCWRSPKKKLDNCPFIWKNFSVNSYLTAYIEDTPSIGSFNFHKYGFLNNPTDYYTRPFLLAGNKLLKIQENGGVDYCMGMLPQVEYLFEYVTEFVKRFHDRSYFNLFWMNSFSHNELNMPTVMDARVEKFLRSIQNYLNSTVVVFFSDHGMRFGKIRETYVGWLEERLPYIYFWLPPSFRSAFPDKYKNLQINKNRLTCPYDLHATLQDILYGAAINTPVGCPKCDTLFKKVAWNRSCEDAGISSHWCTCSSEVESLSTNDAVVLSATNFIIEQINDALVKNVNNTTPGTKCALLSLEKIISVRSKVANSLRLFRSAEYVIVFETKPSGALFEVTVRHRTKFEIVDDSISRINLYGNQSACVKSGSALMKYCFCVRM